MKESKSYDMIQTPIPVWDTILKVLPIGKDDIFFEPFMGDGNLYNLIEGKKEWCEITKGKDIFDYNFETSKVTKIYTNPPFKAMIQTNKGGKKYSNCVYFFLEKFMRELPELQEIGFLMNAKSFQSITPKRMCKLNDLGFYVTNIVLLNIQKWYGLYYFVLFKKESNNAVIPIFKYF